MAKKKDKKAGDKRRAKARQKHQKKRRLKAVKYSKPATYTGGLRSDFAAESLSAPAGFREISSAEAIIQFGRPLLENLVDEVDDPSELMEMLISLWNYEGGLREGTAQDELEEMREAILDKIETVLALDDEEATEVFEEMIKRKRDLFPAEIQPSTGRTFFIRKELSHLINFFNYDDLDYSGDPIPADRQDRAAIDLIRKIDHYVEAGARYNDWDDDYNAMAEAVAKCFERWLQAKGVSEWSSAFTFHMRTYLDFIYQSEHDATLVLRTVSPDYLDEFFFEFLFYDVVAKPQEYVEFMPAVRLFYTFLNEKGYLDDAAYNSVITELDEIEPEFIEALREEYG